MYRPVEECKNEGSLCEGDFYLQPIEELNSSRLKTAANHKYSS